MHLMLRKKSGNLLSHSLRLRNAPTSPLLRNKNTIRSQSTTTSETNEGDLIIGIYEDAKDDLPMEIATKFSFLKNLKWKKEQVRIIYNPEITVNNVNVKRIAVVGLGSKDPAAKKQEEANSKQEEEKEIRGNYKFDEVEQFQQTVTSPAGFSFTRAAAIRNSANAAVKALKSDDEKNTKKVYFQVNDGIQEYTQEVAEGLTLAGYKYELPKQEGQKKNKSKEYNPLLITGTSTEATNSASQQGLVYAESQILAATLAETPANLMTPTIFANTMKEKFDSLNSDKITTHVRDYAWIKENQMNGLITVGKGSDEEPRVLEVHYNGNPNSKEIDLVLVGKGITFDSGGISIKPAAGMKEMKGDCGGATSTQAALHAIARLNLPINVVGIAFLCENMPSGRAVKPGDIIYHKNGKTIEVDNTDAEGRLILSDALYYASQFNPKRLVDCATLTGAAVIALGHEVNAVYTSHNHLWNQIELAGLRTQDYMWRMPLLKNNYIKQLKSHVATLNNIGGRPAGSVTAAVFLSEFVDMDKVGSWAHIDIAGTSCSKDGKMTGRPTRALVEFAKQLAKK